MLKTQGKQYHIGVEAGQIGGYCLLPGDPARCEKIAAFLDNPHHVGMNREYNIWNGTLEGETVTVCSTGIGGPSTAIAVEELAACGAHTMIRIGTCGGIDLPVRAGDVVIASGAVRQDGTSREYAPIEFPAVPDAGVMMALCEAVRELAFSSHIGVVQSKDSFYGQHSPARMPTSGELFAKWEAWKRLHVLASEMEAATLFTVGASLGVATGAVFLTVWNQERFLAGMDTDTGEEHDTERAIRVAVLALRKRILAEKRLKNTP